MASGNYVCTHLSLGVCHCTSTLTHAVDSCSSTNKRKLFKKDCVAAKKKKCNDVEFWKIRKMLKESDVGNMSRLMLGRDVAVDFVLPVLGADADEVDRGIAVNVWDVDTKTMHSLVFKRWVSSKSYVFIGNWGKDFVARRDLKKGDEIALQWNPLKNAFNFSVL